VNEADALYEMVNIYPADSGLPMTVWAGPRGKARHDVRVKVNMTHGNRMTIGNGHAAITAEMAARMAVVLGTTAQYWLNSQNAVDLYDAQERLATSENRPQLMPVFG